MNMFCKIFQFQILIQILLHKKNRLLYKIHLFNIIDYPELLYKPE